MSNNHLGRALVFLLASIALVSCIPKLLTVQHYSGDSKPESRLARLIYGTQWHNPAATQTLTHCFY